MWVNVIDDGEYVMENIRWRMCDGECVNDVGNNECDVSMGNI